MSWMTKGGSSSALGQSPLRFPLNELARRGVATTAYDFASAAGVGFRSRSLAALAGGDHDQER